jgi:apolipoprotein D and lipocalin family protein
MRKIVKSLIPLLLTACSSASYNETVKKVDIDRFMGKWYVIAARGTFLESEAYNSLEVYKWNKNEKRIDIDFTYRDGSFTSELKSVPQKGWILDNKTNAHWEVSPFWPIKFDYLVIDLAQDYSWVVIGVPNQKYIWIMARDWKIDDELYNYILARIKKKKYSLKNLRKVPQKW